MLKVLISTDNAKYPTPPAPSLTTLAAHIHCFSLWQNSELKQSYEPWKIWGPVVSFVDIVWRSSMINSFTEFIMTRAKATPPVVFTKFFNGDGVLGVLPYSPWWPPNRSCSVQYTATSTSPAVTTALFNLSGITYNNHPFHTRHNDRHGPYRTRAHSRLFFPTSKSDIYLGGWRLGGMLWSVAGCGRTQERSWMACMIGDEWHI